MDEAAQQIAAQCAYWLEGVLLVNNPVNILMNELDIKLKKNDFPASVGRRVSPSKKRQK